MRIAGLLNTIDRYGITKNVVEENLKYAGDGVKVDLFITDNGSTDQKIIDWGKDIAKKWWGYGSNIGNSQAKNIKLKYALDGGYDWIFILDNDILLPRNWAGIAINTRDKMKMQAEDAGMIGFSWRGYGDAHFEPETQTFRPKRVFGSWGAHREVFDKVGYFVELSKYGIWDSEFNERTTRAGFINVYPMQPSQHLGHDVHDDPEYRRFKDEQLILAQEKLDALQQEVNIRIEWDDRKR